MPLRSSAAVSCLLIVVALTAAVACTPAAPPATSERVGAHQQLTPAIRQVLDDIRAADAGQLAISEEDGRFLRMLVVSSGTRHALEIGGASGYSAIWIGLGLRDTGGSLVTIEYDPDRARQLEANIARTGLDDTVTVVAGDAFKAIPQIEGTFDFVFLDASKPDYQRFFEMTFPRLDRGGLFLAHNVVNKRDDMPDFLTTVDQHPDLLTTIVSPGAEGMSVSVKR
jgi:predicted O-methyltransferase YrrM